MMLAGPTVPDGAVEELASLLRDSGAEELADRLDRALDAEVKLIALSLDERAIMLSALEDPPQELAELPGRPSGRPPVATPAKGSTLEGATRCPSSP